MDDQLQSILQAIGGIVPAKWRMTLTVLVIASPFIGRVIQSIRTNGGLKGIFASIWLGTNSPKTKTETDIPKQ